jgi:hypothetical protein
MLLIALFCGWLASVIRGRRLQAGLFLAGAICLKIIPGFLLLVPLARRDGRCLAGCALGLLVGLFLLPALVMGPGQTVGCYTQIYRDVLAPALHQDNTALRADELTNIATTDSQSFVVILHNSLNLDRFSRPLTLEPGLFLWHWGIGATLTLLTLWAFRRRAGGLPHGLQEALFGGCLIVLMAMLSPVCHTHYFCLTVPLALGLMALGRGDSVYPHWSICLLLAINAVGNLLPQLQTFTLLRDAGLAMYVTLLLWATACLAAAFARPRSQSLSAEKASLGVSQAA